MTESTYEAAICASCGGLSVVIERPPGYVDHVPGAWPIALCGLGHTSWRRSDGRWYDSLPVWSESDLTP